MKKQPKAKIVKNLATQFEAELKQNLPVTVRPDGSIVYKTYYIKSKKNGNWALYDTRTKDQVDEFFLKTCALMAAKAYCSTNIEKFLEIKRLDSSYWANQCDNIVFRNNLKKVKDFERYLILLNRLEETELQMSYFKDEISRMFQWSFV